MINRSRTVKKIKCNAIDYRKGFIEVTTNGHAGLINLECWNVQAGEDISKVTDDLSPIKDEYFTGNVELELTPENAKELIKSLEKILKTNS